MGQVGLFRKLMDVNLGKKKKKTKKIQKAKSESWRIPNKKELNYYSNCGNSLKYQAIILLNKSFFNLYLI